MEKKESFEAELIRFVTTPEFLSVVKQHFSDADGSEGDSEEYMMAFKNYMLSIPQPETYIVKCLKKYLLSDGDEFYGLIFITWYNYHHEEYEEYEEFFKSESNVMALIHSKLI